MNCRRIFFIGAMFLLFIFQGSALAEMVSVKSDDINMRSGPGTNYSVKYTLGSGMPLEVISHSGDWLNIRDFEGDTGWVYKSTVNSTPHVVIKASKNSDTNVNIRSGPGTDNAIVATASSGVVFKKISEKDQWVQVEHEEGIKGWIYSNLLWGF
jgi:SH3-like domain-containing protein